MWVTKPFLSVDGLVICRYWLFDTMIFEGFMEAGGASCL
jgi:hypothetical protein